jgi:molybdate transport system substrate-binding protein
MPMPAEIRVFALQSPQIVIGELAAAFEQRTGYRIAQLLRHADLPRHVKPRIDAGEPFDVAFLESSLLDQVAQEGKVLSDTRANFLRVPIGVAVRAGAPRPDVSSVDAFKRMLLDARSIAYLKAGVSGPYLDGLFERFGIATELQPKASRPNTDTVGDLVANGEAEVGITAIATLMATRGVDIVGTLPASIQSYVCFAGAVSSNATVPAIARALIDFVTGPSALPIIQAKGMEVW